MMGLNRLILLLISIVVVFNGSIALSEDSGIPNINQSYISDSAGKSLKSGTVYRSRFSKRNLEMKTGSQAEVSRKNTEPSANKLKLFGNSPYNIFTLYPDELGPSQLLNDDSKPVEEQFDFNGWFGSRKSTTKVFFGTLPFVSVPVSNNNEEEQESNFISKDSIFVFWYFKRSF